MVPGTALVLSVKVVPGTKWSQQIFEKLLRLKMDVGTWYYLQKKTKVVPGTKCCHKNFRDMPEYPKKIFFSISWGLNTGTKGDK